MGAKGTRVKGIVSNRKYIRHEARRAVREGKHPRRAGLEDQT
jgi:hypothetical protein